MIIVLTILALIGLITSWMLWPLFDPTAQRDYNRHVRLEEAKIRYQEARADQIADQTEGIVQRYRMTRENRINAMLRQRKQELEIAKLQAQVKLLERELGSRDEFTPDD